MDLLVGYGEIGKGLYENFSIKPEVLDPDKGINLDPSLYVAPLQIEIMHICIPGNIKSFKSTVSQLIQTYKPLFTVIHSTVVPGTTRDIRDITDSRVLHCPIRGKHPNMTTHIKQYALHIGGPDAELVAHHFNRAGLPETICHSTSEETELGKILELYRYGKAIQEATEMKQLCEVFGVDYKTTVTSFITSYNKGLDRVGYPQYKQPQITPMEGGHLGGHCVIENCWELLKQLNGEQLPIVNELAELIEFGKGDRILEW